MLEKSKEIVKEYILQHSGKTKFNVNIICQYSALQSQKFLISTSLDDGVYYEVTYNYAVKEFYIDAYKRIEKIRDDETKCKEISSIMRERGYELHTTTDDGILHFRKTIKGGYSLRCDVLIKPNRCTKFRFGFASLYELYSDWASYFEGDEHFEKLEKRFLILMHSLETATKNIWEV